MIEPSPPPPPGPPPPPQPPAASEPPGTARPSRRWFLAGGVALVLGGGAGVLAEILHESSPPSPAPPPAALSAAIEAERALLADLDATTGGSPHIRQLVAAVRADHAAHLSALRRTLRATTPVRPPHDVPVHGRPRTLAELRAAERKAAAVAAQHATALDGAAAALLASIAACEATHAELLR
jgi:Ferritin-like domain